MAKMTKPSTTLTEAPEFHAENDPRYRAAKDKLTELQGKYGEIDRRISAEQARVNSERLSNHQLAQAEALAYGTEAPALISGQTLAKLLEERQVLAQAVELAERRFNQ